MNTKTKKRALMSEEDVMLEVKMGKIEKASILFEAYHVKLYNFFLRLTFNKPVSQDLTQNVFYRLIKYRKSYRSGSSFKSWIYQISRNALADYYKKQQLRIADYADVENLDIEAQNETDQVEKDRNLNKALAMLDESDRELLVLNRFQGLKYEEIATLFKCSQGAIKVKAHRAINQLRDYYFMIEKNQ